MQTYPLSAVLSDTCTNFVSGILLDGKKIQHEHQPVYLAVTLVHSLTFRAHMLKTAAKVRTRNNLINKLAGSSWGARASTLWTATLALCFSVAEYCAPIWCRSTHTKLVDSQLNSAMRTILGSVMLTPVQWLPVLWNIASALSQRPARTNQPRWHPPGSNQL